MFRRFVSVTLLVSIVALGSSGLLMIILDSFEFQLQMHPVHKVFGIIMCAAGCLHVYLNIKPIKTYLKSKTLLVAGLRASSRRQPKALPKPIGRSCATWWGCLRRFRGLQTSCPRLAELCRT